MKRYLSIPGALLLIVAFMRASLNVEWDTISMSLAASGAVIVVLTAVWNRREVIEWIRDPRGIFAVTTGVSVAAFIAALVMVNIAVWYNPWSVDLTANGRNQVSQGTRDMLGRLREPVTLREFGRASDPKTEQLLHGFERETPRIRVEFADVDRQREMAVKYGVIKLGTVIVLAGDKFRKIEDPNEQALMTAVLQVTSKEDRVVCFVTGHGERGIANESPSGLSRLNATLEASNYRTERVSLLEGEVPTQCAALVVPGARQEFAPGEMDRLTNYLGRAGRIAFLLEPDPLPSFHDWLTERGIEPLPGSIVDASGAGRSVGGGPRTTLALSYGSHQITRGFEVATLFEGARPLRMVEQPQFGGKPLALAQTGARTFSSVSTEPAPTLDTARGDTNGPFSLAAVTSIGGVNQVDQQVRIVVIGDSDFISNAFVGRQGNRDFFLRGLSWLLGEEEATIVAVDGRQNRRIELTERTRALMYIIDLGVLPLLPLVAGVVVFIRNRGR